MINIILYHARIIQSGHGATGTRGSDGRESSRRLIGSAPSTCPIHPRYPPHPAPRRWSRRIEPTDWTGVEVRWRGGGGESAVCEGACEAVSAQGPRAPPSLPPSLSHRYSTRYSTGVPFPSRSLSSGPLPPSPSLPSLGISPPPSSVPPPSLLRGEEMKGGRDGGTEEGRQGWEGGRV